MKKERPEIKPYREIVRKQPGDSRTVQLIRKALRDGVEKILAQVTDSKLQRCQISGAFQPETFAGRVTLVQSDLDIRDRDALCVRGEVIDALHKVLGPEIDEQKLDWQDPRALFLFSYYHGHPEFPFEIMRLEPIPVFDRDSVFEFVRFKKLLGAMYNPLGISDEGIRHLNNPYSEPEWIVWHVGKDASIHPCHPANIGLEIRPFSIPLPKPMPLRDIIDDMGRQGSLSERLHRFIKERQ